MVFTVRFFPSRAPIFNPLFPSQILVHMMTLSDPALNPEKNFNFLGIFFSKFFVIPSIFSHMFKRFLLNQPIKNTS